MIRNLLSLAVVLSLLMCCTKSVSKTGVSSGSSVVEFVNVNSVTNDSVTTDYFFDDDGYLAKQSFISKNPPSYLTREYTRDDMKRIIKITSLGAGDTLISDVHYATGSEIAYAVQYSVKDPSEVTDSVTYEYLNGKVSRINSFLQGSPKPEQPTYYFTYEYTGSNISKIHTFWIDDDGIYNENLDFDLEYDDKINPLFSPDDIFLGIAGFGFNICASSNNFTRQTNHYGGVYEDYVVYDYIYGPDNKPTSVTWSGPGITTVYGFYFYK